MRRKRERAKGREVPPHEDVFSVIEIHFQVRLRRFLETGQCYVEGVMGPLMRSRRASPSPSFRASLVALFGVGALVLGGAACSGGSTPSAPVIAAPFVAFESDFADFHAWESFALTMDIAPGNDHLNGPRHLFLNR